MKNREEILEEMNSIIGTILREETDIAVHRHQGQYAALNWVLEETESEEESKAQ